MELEEKFKLLNLQNAAHFLLKSFPSKILNTGDVEFSLRLNPRTLDFLKLKANDLVEIHPLGIIIPVRPVISVASEELHIPDTYKTDLLGQKVSLEKYSLIPTVVKSVNLKMITGSPLDDLETLKIKCFLSSFGVLQENIIYSFCIQRVGKIEEMNFQIVETLAPGECFVVDSTFSLKVISKSSVELTNITGDPNFEKITKILKNQLLFSSWESKKHDKHSHGILFYGSSRINLAALIFGAALSLGIRVITVVAPIEDKISSWPIYLGDDPEAKNPQKYTMVFIPDIDLIFSGDGQNRAFSIDRLVNALDCAEITASLLIATATEPEGVDSSIRRAGRFNHEIEISSNAPRFVKQEDHVLGYDDDNPEEFISARCKDEIPRTKPSQGSRSGQKLSWRDIGGQTQIKKRLLESLMWPLRYPHIFQRFGISPPKGVLLYGPPGCSKTMLARVIATEYGMNFFSIKGPEIFSKWVGEAENKLAKIFTLARKSSPSVIFIDELDAIAGQRDQISSGSGARVLSQLLVEIDGVETTANVLILAATNRPDYIDKALLRPGRFDIKIYVTLPDLNTRISILKIATEKMPLEQIDYNSLAELCDGYSGAEITALCQEAAFQAFISGEPHLCMKHFITGLSIVKPRITKDMLLQYEDFLKNSKFTG